MRLNPSCKGCFRAMAHLFDANALFDPDLVDASYSPSAFLLSLAGNNAAGQRRAGTRRR
jgi:hypothetical protein